MPGVVKGGKQKIPGDNISIVITNIQNKRKVQSIIPSCL